MPQSKEIRFKSGTPKEVVFKALKNIARSRAYNEIETYEVVGVNLQEFTYLQSWDDDRPCWQIAYDCHEYV